MSSSLEIKPTNEKKKKEKEQSKEILDPRQSLMLQYLFDRKSPTFSDFKNSAIKAGFSKTYSDIISANKPDWLSGSIRQLNRETLLRKAERNFDKALDLETAINLVING